MVTEDDWHEALRRGRWVETPVQLAEQIGVPMDEDVGTLADIIAACADRWHWPLFLSLWGKSGTSYARRVSDDQAGGRALAEALEAGRTSRAGELLDRQAIHRPGRGIQQGFGDIRPAKRPPISASWRGCLTSRPSSGFPQSRLPYT